MKETVLVLVDLKVENYTIQECIPAHCLNSGFRATGQFPLDETDIPNIAQIFTNFEIRMAG